MNSKYLHKLLVIQLVLTIGISCTNNQRTIKEIDYKTTYKFSSEIEDKVRKDTVPWKHQIAAADYTTKGDYKNALIQWDLAMRGRATNYTQEEIDSINKKYKKVTAKDYIVNQAKKSRVLIINEAHHSSLHRVFTKSLLQELYNNGYKNLGLEALGNGEYLDAELNTRKYPLQNTGYYIKDPQFGNLVRDALEIGFYLFAYENTQGGNGKPREIAQAKNIQKVMQSKPNEKFLIHCGFDHALEGKHRSWEKAMAARLTEYTGENPLTVNQVFYSEKGNTKWNHPLLKALNITTPTVLLDEYNTPYKYQRGKAYTDIAVFHPPTQYINNKAHWSFNNNYQNVPITLSDVAIDFPVLVLAYKKGEDINKAVPIDITEVKKVTDISHLNLQKGKYTIVITNKKKSFAFEQTVK